MIDYIHYKLSEPLKDSFVKKSEQTSFAEIFDIHIKAPVDSLALQNFAQTIERIKLECVSSKIFEQINAKNTNTSELDNSETENKITADTIELFLRICFTPVSDILQQFKNLIKDDVFLDENLQNKISDADFDRLLWVDIKKLMCIYTANFMTAFA